MSLALDLSPKTHLEELRKHLNQTHHLFVGSRDEEGYVRPLNNRIDFEIVHLISPFRDVFGKQFQKLRKV
jgi:hypothetical protein